LIEDISELQERKAYLLIHLLEYKFSPIVPQILTVKEFGYQALELLTCYSLSITAICSSLKESIQNVISSIINSISADDAPPTTPKVRVKGSSSSNSIGSGGRVNATSLIINYLDIVHHILVDYFRWCESNSHTLIKDSRKDEIIQSVDSSLRAWLKNEFVSSNASKIISFCIFLILFI
jgi:hypothetical protein